VKRRLSERVDRLVSTFSVAIWSGSGGAMLVLSALLAFSFAVERDLVRALVGGVGIYIALICILVSTRR
jgi:hypothetical protein